MTCINPDYEVGPDGTEVEIVCECCSRRADALPRLERVARAATRLHHASALDPEWLDADAELDAALRAIVEEEKT